MKSLLLLLSVLFSSLFVFAADPIAGLKALPVQDGGRIKPFDTFAREMMQLIHGKETYKLEDSKASPRPATEIVMTWILQPDVWSKTALFEVRHGQLKKGLRLDESRKHFSFDELMNNDRLSTLMQELQSKRESKEKLDPYFQALQRLENQLFSFREIASGRMIRLAPPKTGDAWLGLESLPGELPATFVEISKYFIEYLEIASDSSKSSNASEIKKKMSEATTRFQDLARAENPDLYADQAKIKTELMYNNVHPFKWSWILYLLAAVCCFLAWIFNKQSFYRPAWGLVILGLLIHSFGFAIRVYLTDRPPVSNMYETVIWVGFGTVVFSMIIEAMYRWKFVLLAGSLVGALCLALGDMAPAVLDPTLAPLEPVLRNNFWLLVHVLTITISYAAFFLAFALGDIGLVYYLKDEQIYREKIKAITLAIYRAMQIGVALLAPGIILGGIWADYSWGRFWGWDPKETWALIVLLGYLAVLHGRLIGLIKDFGMIASAIITFSLVIMAWYGVNFVLGAGLHSYGFGAGGVEYVSIFVGVHLLYVIFVSVVRNSRLKAGKS